MNIVCDPLLRQMIEDGHREVAADYLLDLGLDLEAAWMREEGYVPSADKDSLDSFDLMGCLWVMSKGSGYHYWKEECEYMDELSGSFESDPFNDTGEGSGFLAAGKLSCSITGSASVDRITPKGNGWARAYITSQ